MEFVGRADSLGLRHRALAAAGPDPELAAELAALGRGFAVEGAWANAAGQ
ncbi:hypothetical protein AB0H18_16910 [Streptomyces sp. NPDC020766]